MDSIQVLLLSVVERMIKGDFVRTSKVKGSLVQTIYQFEVFGFPKL